MIVVTFGTCRQSFYFAYSAIEAIERLKCQKFDGNPRMFVMSVTSDALTLPAARSSRETMPTG